MRLKLKDKGILSILTDSAKLSPHVLQTKQNLFECSNRKRSFSSIQSIQLLFITLKKESQFAFEVEDILPSTHKKLRRNLANITDQEFVEITSDQIKWRIETQNLRGLIIVPKECWMAEELPKLEGAPTEENSKAMRMRVCYCNMNLQPIIRRNASGE